MAGDVVHLRAGLDQRHCKQRQQIIRRQRERALVLGGLGQLQVPLDSLCQRCKRILQRHELGNGALLCSKHQQGLGHGRHAAVVHVLNAKLERGDERVVAADGAEALVGGSHVRAHRGEHFVVDLLMGGKRKI